MYTVVRRPDAFGPDNTGAFVDWARSAGADHAYVLELKATNIATHTDRYEIEREPFAVLVKELEAAMVTVADLLLTVPMEGAPPPKLLYRPKVSSSASSASSASSGTASKASGKASAKKRASGTAR